MRVMRKRPGPGSSEGLRLGLQSLRHNPLCVSGLGVQVRLSNSQEIGGLYYKVIHHVEKRNSTFRFVLSRNRMRQNKRKMERVETEGIEIGRIATQWKALSYLWFRAFRSLGVSIQHGVITPE